MQSNLEFILMRPTLSNNLASTTSVNFNLGEIHGMNISKPYFLFWHELYMDQYTVNI